MSLFNELKRRNVIRVAIAYLVIAWLIVQVIGVLSPMFDVSGGFQRGVVLLLTVGFVPAMFFSWAFELTPEGIKKEKEVVRDDSITNITAKKLDYITLAAAVGVLGLFGYQQMNPPQTIATVQTIESNLVIAEDTIDAASIAVLPFADLSPEGDHEYFADGISEELLNVLVRVDGIKVASRTSSFAFKGQETLGIPNIAKQLKVRHVLEGSIRTAGDSIRITAQLIDANTDQHLWSETYDRTLTVESIFKIQDDISSEIVKALRTKLGATIGETQSLEMITNDMQAYDFYLQAKNNVHKRIKLLEADELLKQALVQDPNFVEAWELLATIYVVINEYGGTDLSPQENLQKSIEFTDRALAINPNSSVAIAVRANGKLAAYQYQVTAQQQELNWQEVILEFERAVQLDSHNQNALNWLGLTYMSVGKTEKALKIFKSCLNIDAFHTACAENYVATMAVLGRDEEAIETLLLYLDKGVHKPKWIPLGMLARQGKELAFKSITNSQNLFFGWRRHDELYEAYRNPGLYEELAQDLLLFARKQTEISDPEISFYLLPIGAYDLPTFMFLEWDASYILYRQSSEFKSFIKKSGIHTYWRKTGFPPQCRAVGEDDFECD